MSNIVVALLILGLVFALASFGVYSDSAATISSARANRIAGALERQISEVQAQRDENGSLPTSATATVNGGVTISYALVSGKGYVCATVAMSNPALTEALDLVQSARSAWFISGGCGVPTTAITTNRVLSAEV